MITLEKVNKVYSNGLHAVKDVSLKVNKGDIFGIIGLSGAGKSSLIRLINRLEEPTSGKIFINGENVLEFNKKQLLERRKKIGMNIPTLQFTFFKNSWRKCCFCIRNCKLE